MKPSHFNAPRTLAECQWTTGYTSVQHALDRSRGFMFWDCVIAAIAGAVAVLMWQGVI